MPTQVIDSGPLNVHQSKDKPYVANMISAPQTRLLSTPSTYYLLKTRPHLEDRTTGEYKLQVGKQDKHDRGLKISHMQ